MSTLLPEANRGAAPSRSLSTPISSISRGKSRGRPSGATASSGTASSGMALSGTASSGTASSGMASIATIPNTSIIPAPNANITRRRKIIYSSAALAAAALAGIGALYLYGRDRELAKKLVTDASPAFSGVDVDDARAMFRELAQGRTLDLANAIRKVHSLLSMKGGKRRSTRKNKRRSH